MSLFGALNIGQSALATQQAALQVTGNNIANAGDPNYTREVANTTPGPSQQIAPGIFIGSGVDLTAVQRQIDQTLEARVRGANSDNQSATTTQTWLSQVESSFNALGTTNISTQMNTFFSDWSSLANTPQDTGARQVVLQDGDSVAQALNNEGTQLSNIQSSLQQQITSNAQTANGYAQQIADLNGQIVVSAGGSAGSSNSLLDQHDSILSKLSGLVNIQTVIQPSGSVNVYVGSEPLIDGTVNNGITVQQQTVNNQAESTLIFKNNKGPLNPTSGTLGAMQTLQTQIAGAQAQVDGLAHNLISAVNTLHASGQGTEGFSSVTASNAVGNPTAALNSPAAGLQFSPTNGSFVVSVTNATTGLSTSTLVPVSLTRAPTDTSLNSLAASLNAITGVTITNGKLNIASTSGGSTISFSQDSSGTLASLGINTFFTGSNAENIGVNQVVQGQPTLIAAAQNGDSGDNQTALAIAALNTRPLTSLGGVSLQDAYQATINGVSGQVATATTNAQATQAVQETLSAQHDSLSGVSLDEESINMITQQRTYQGAALFITTVNNMMASLLAMVTT